MNTLFRKAIERSMVHPYYIDEISTRYARRIENASMEEQPAIIGSMVREYCAYVRKYSLKEYSPLVQKIILAYEKNQKARAQTPARTFKRK